jgi:DnaJ family protein A protein 2
MVHMQTMCPECNGEGFKVPKNGHCKPCSGSGVVRQKEVFNVTIPKGCPEGHQVRFQGKADQLPGHTAGDVVVEVRLKSHPSYVRLSHGISPDLAVKKEVSLADALAGSRMDLKLVSGETVSVSVDSRKIVGPQDIYVARGLGLPRYDGSTNGDLYVLFSVKFPSKLEEISSDDRERILKALGSESSAACSVLSSLFKDSSVEQASEKTKTVVLEKLASKEKTRQVLEAFAPPEPKRGPQFNTTAHQEQCHQQ